MDVLSIYLPSFFIMLGMSIVSPILPLYAESFNISFTLASLAISAYAFGRFLADVPVGILADRIGRKPLMIWGTVLLTLMALANAFATSFWEFLIYRFFQGVGSAMWMTSRTTLLADILKPKDRGRIMGYFQAFMLLGSSVGPTVGGFVAAVYGLAAPFYFYAATGVVSLVLSYFLIHENKESMRKHREGEGFSLASVKRLLSNASFSMACLATFTVFFMRTGIRSTILPLYANDVLGLDEIAIGTVISFATITNLVLAVPVGHAIDYFGRKPIIILTLSITALSAFLFPMTTDYLTISLVAVVLGIGTGGAGQAPLALATDATADEPHGVSMGVYRLFGDIGFVIGPIVLGLVADGFGLSMPFYVMGLIIIVNVVLLWLFAKETYSRRMAAKTSP
jgi:multidrug resistance protein